MERQLLRADQIHTALANLEGWAADGTLLKRRFEFDNFAAALAFVNQVSEIGEALDHHPDITFGWGYAEISTTTHDRGGITDFDFELARRVDRI